MWLRRLSYQKGLARQYRLPVPVIVVGNLSVGGTGKTPLVILLVEHLQAKGWKPGIISRGYGGSAGARSKALKLTDTPAEVGDEPMMMLRRTGSPVVVGPDRVSSAQKLIDQFACNIVISDDGFQHLRLYRDIDIVVIDGERRFGNGWCLPAGPLREFRNALRDADIRVVNSAEPSHRDEFPMTIESELLYRLDAPEINLTLGELRGRKLHAVAGLGNPQRFFDALRREALQFESHRFPDHHAFSAADFKFVQQDDVLIMSEKDAIKCGDIGLFAETWVMPIRAVLNNEFYQNLDSSLSAVSNNPQGVTV